MSVAGNKETLRRWFTETVRGGTDAQTFRAGAERTFAPHFVDHDGPNPASSYEALIRAVPGLLAALPDARLTVEQLIGEGDLVAVRLRGEGTHTGELPGKPPTGKRIAWTENEIFRFEDGRIAESWGEGTLDEALASIGLGFRAAPH
ncbi:MAG TPA: ester cyclase [Thermomicrobiales bacterium]|nr:ester cyclase [Thermomicrobiales bacterium]